MSQHNRIFLAGRIPLVTFLLEVIQRDITAISGLSADAYAAFEEAAKKTGSVLDSLTGQKYLQEILEVGGSRPAAESFKAFRGREPQIDALLRHGGLA